MNDLIFLNILFDKMIKDLDECSLIVLKKYIEKELDNRDNTILNNKDLLIKWL